MLADIGRKQFNEHYALHLIDQEQAAALWEPTAETAPQADDHDEDAWMRAQCGL